MSRSDGYVFVEAGPLCAHALRKRTAAHPNVHVLEGDANSGAVHDQIRALIPTGALTVMYADPEDLDDFDFQTVRFFTERYPHVDWLVNFRVMGAVRYLAAGREERAVPLFDHPTRRSCSPPAGGGRTARTCGSPTSASSKRSDTRARMK